MESTSKRTARPAPNASQITIQSWLGARRETAFVRPVAETLNRRILLSPSLPETSWQGARKSKRMCDASRDQRERFFRRQGPLPLVAARNGLGDGSAQVVSTLMSHTIEKHALG